MILEAMKMEIDIVAPKDGKIATINVNVNDAVADQQLLATME
jgi:pyruvate carboxylase subunit B